MLRLAPALCLGLSLALCSALAAQTPRPSPETPSAPANTSAAPQPLAAHSARQRASVVIDNRCGETVVIHFRWRNPDQDDRWSTARWTWAPGPGALAHRDVNIRSLARRAMIHVARADGSPLMEGEERHDYQGQSVGFTPILLNDSAAPDLVLCALE